QDCGERVCCFHPTSRSEISAKCSLSSYRDFRTVWFCKHL
ncbi:na+ dependent nucleoside transporter family protein, partial [Vibrio parahaemolyticus EKP-028]